MKKNVMGCKNIFGKLRGAKISGEKIRGVKKRLRGAKIFWKNLRGAKISGEGIRGVKFLPFSRKDSDRVSALENDRR